MFIRKIKLVAATAVVVLTLGVGGLAYRAGGQTAPAEKLGPKKPLSELEALRRENHLLKLNLEVVLEKVASLEAQMRALRGKAKTAENDAQLGKPPQGAENSFSRPSEVAPEGAKPKGYNRPQTGTDRQPLKPTESPFRDQTREAGLEWRGQQRLFKQVEAALSMLRDARDKDSQRKAVDALEKALRSFRGKMKPVPGEDKALPR